MAKPYIIEQLNKPEKSVEIFNNASIFTPGIGKDSGGENVEYKVTDGLFSGAVSGNTWHNEIDMDIVKSVITTEIETLVKNSNRTLTISDCMNLIAGKEYTALINVKSMENFNNADTGFFAKSIGGTETTIGTLKRGINKIIFTPNDNNTSLYFFISSGEADAATVELSRDILIIEGDYADKELHFITGTKSTNSDIRVESIGKNSVNPSLTVPKNLDDYIFGTNDYTATETGITFVTTDRFTGIMMPVTLKPNANYNISYIKNKNARIIIKPRVGTQSLPAILSNNVDTSYSFMTTQYQDYWLVIDDNGFTGTTEITNLQLELGTTATAYEPYKSNTAYLATPDGQPNRSVGTANDEFRDVGNGVEHVKRVSDDLTLDGSDAVAFYDLTTDIGKRISFGIPDNIKPLSVLTVHGNEYKQGTWTDITNYIGYYYVDDTGVLYLSVAGNTAESTQHLNDNPVTINYQLATPVVTQLDDILPLQVYENGTIIIEAFMKKLLSYATASGGLSWTTPVSEIEKIETNIGGELAEVDSATYTLASDGLSVKVYTDDTKTVEVNDNSLYWVYAPVRSEESTVPEVAATYDINKAASDASVNARALANTVDISRLNNNIKLAQERIDNITGDVAGVTWNQSTDTFQRIGSSPNFNSLMPWAGMRRCNLSDAGMVLAYYGDPDYAEDGSNGQVMVQIPKFWYRTGKVGSLYSFEISATERSGFKLHPAFRRNGVEKDFVYLSAYEGSIYDVSEVTYLLVDEQVADFTVGTGDLLCSIANAKPCSGLTQELTLPNSRILANNRGNGWELQDFMLVSAVQILFLVEYASFDTQAKIGRGVVDKASGEGNEAELTGQTSSLGNTSGMASGTNGLVSVSYRGIENFWGNIWKWVDGLNIKADNLPYFADSDFVSDKFDGNYVYGEEALTNANGYASDVVFNSVMDFAFLPSEVTGSSSTFLRDYYYQNTGNRVARLGSGWGYSVFAGGFSWVLGDSAASRYRYVGARLIYV